MSVPTHIDYRVRKPTTYEEMGSPTANAYFQLPPQGVNMNHSLPVTPSAVNAGSHSDWKRMRLHNLPPRMRANSSSSSGHGHSDRDDTQALTRAYASQVQSQLPPQHALESQQVFPQFVPQQTLYRTRTRHRASTASFIPPQSHSIPQQLSRPIPPIPLPSPAPISSTGVGKPLRNLPPRMQIHAQRSSPDLRSRVRAAASNNKQLPPIPVEAEFDSPSAPVPNSNSTPQTQTLPNRAASIRRRARPQIPLTLPLPNPLLALPQLQPPSPTSSSSCDTHESLGSSFSHHTHQSELLTPPPPTTLEDTWIAGMESLSLSTMENLELGPGTPGEKRYLPNPSYDPFSFSFDSGAETETDE